MTELTEKEKILEFGEVEECDLLSDAHSFNKSFKVKLRGDIYGVFKPKSGEMNDLRTAIIGGTYYKRECASYLVDKFLGLGLIPVTVIREIDIKEIDDKIGSLQEFIPKNKTASLCKNEELKKFHEEFVKLFALDYVIYNSDRHNDNYIIAGNKLYAIDNGLTFGKNDLIMGYLGYVKPNFSEIYVITEKIKHFLESQDKREELQELLQDLLKTGETEACFARMEYLFKFISFRKELPIVKSIFFRRSKTRKILPFWP